MVGETYGRLTVLEWAGGKPARWLCQCTCGQTAVVTGKRLRSGNTKSCGCRQRETQLLNGTGNRKEVVAYAAAHERVWAERGKAKYQGCADCPAPAIEWSYDYTDPDELHEEKRGFYSLKPEHYSARCKACHVKFDKERCHAR